MRSQKGKGREGTRIKGVKILELDFQFFLGWSSGTGTKQALSLKAGGPGPCTPLTSAAMLQHSARAKRPDRRYGMQRASHADCDVTHRVVIAKVARTDRQQIQRVSHDDSVTLDGTTTKRRDWQSFGATYNAAAVVLGEHEGREKCTSTFRFHFLWNWHLYTRSY